MDKINFEELYKIVVKDLVPVIERKIALSQFVRRLKSWEKWLQVELIDVLLKHGYDAVPEDQRVDVSFGNVGIELKIVITNYGKKDDWILHKQTKSTPKIVDKIIDDVFKLEETSFKYLYVIFIVFPLDGHEFKQWQQYFKKIESQMLILNQFQFKIGKSPALIYVGQTAKVD